MRGERFRRRSSQETYNSSILLGSFVFKQISFYNVKVLIAGSSEDVAILLGRKGYIEGGCKGCMNLNVK